ncbi:MAG: hypothetical protein ACC651_06240 [Candidatus Scalindua sp.]
MASNLKVQFKKNYDRMEQLTFLKERYKKLILEPEREIESEIEKDLNEEESIDTPSVDSLYQ